MLQISKTKKIDLEKLMDYLEKKDAWPDFYNGIGEDQGYCTDTCMITADWNKAEKLYDYLDSYEEDNFIALHWSDEVISCSGCGAAIVTTPSTYGDEGAFMHSGGVIFCKKCSIDNFQGILLEYIDNSKIALKSWALELLEKEGFTCFEDTEVCSQYETGWYSGMDDDPEKVLKKIKEILPGYMVVFILDYVSQFSIGWSAYVRKGVEK
ncbi:MAG: hypothetical protein DRN81_06830 [Thermoproteota archaeon]|nr:MAG: hypothetical protein DRN81_06830 [Candidatus Korarchaeota archaeon]